LTPPSCFTVWKGKPLLPLHCRYVEKWFHTTGRQTYTLKSVCCIIHTKPTVPFVIVIFTFLSSSLFYTDNVTRSLAASLSSARHGQ
jgi:hypothetical protein